MGDNIEADLLREAKIQRHATVLPPHITRRHAYDRRTDDLHMTQTE